MNEQGLPQVTNSELIADLEAILLELRHRLDKFQTDPPPGALVYSFPFLERRLPALLPGQVRACAAVTAFDKVNT